MLEHSTANLTTSPVLPLPLGIGPSGVVGTTAAPGTLAMPPPPGASAAGTGAPHTADNEQTMALCGTLKFKVSGVHLVGKVAEAAVEAALVSVLSLTNVDTLTVHAGLSKTGPPSSTCASGSSSEALPVPPVSRRLDGEKVTEWPPPPSVEDLFLEPAENWWATYTVKVPAARVGDVMASVRQVSDAPG